MGVRDGERGYWTEPVRRDPDDPPPVIGRMCRCLECCCPSGEGHNSPGWLEWEARQSEDKS